MRPRLRNRLLQTCALLLVVTAGTWGYHQIVRPDPTLLGRLAEAELRTIFGDRVEYTARFDLVDGVEILGLRVYNPGAERPTLEAHRVEIQHDVIALASGLYRPLEIHIDGARIGTRETPGGIAPDFPFHLETEESTGAFPALRLHDATVIVRAMENSESLAAEAEIEFGSVDLDVEPRPTGELALLGTARPVGLDQSDTLVLAKGTADPAAERLDVTIRWDPVHLSQALLDKLADTVASRLQGQLGQTGMLVVKLVRIPDVEEGDVQVAVNWKGEVKMDLESLPGGEVIRTSDVEQIEQFFHRMDIKVEFKGGRVILREGSMKALEQGTAKMVGVIRDGGASVRVAISLKGIELENPDVRDAFSEAGREVFDLFDPGGTVDAEILITREPETGIEWQVDAFLSNTSFRYVGTPDDEGRPRGFPYPVDHAAGRLHMTAAKVWCDDIVGFNGNATARLRSPWEEAWTGGETGRIHFTDEGTDIRLTVDVIDMPTNENLDLAVAGSEFADLFEEFQLEGVIDHVEIDVIQVAGRDTQAYPEVRITLEDEQLCYARFPVLLTGVKGMIKLRQPHSVGPAEREPVYAFDVRGRTEGSAVHLAGAYNPVEEAGHLVVHAKDLALAGPLGDAVLGSKLTEGGVAEAWRWLDPRGRADVHLKIPLEEAAGDVSLVAQLRNASIRLDAEDAEDPIEITDLHGTLSIEGNQVQLAGLRGRIRGTDVTIEGRMNGGPEGEWDILLQSRDRDGQDTQLRLTPDLLSGIEQLAGSALLPRGLELGAGARLALGLRLRRAAGPDQPVRIDMLAKNLDGIVHMPEGTALALTAERIEVRGEDVTVRGVVGEAPGMLVEINEARFGEDGLEGRITLHLEEIEPTPEMLALLPEEVRDTLAEQVEGRRLTCEALTLDARPDGSLVMNGDLALIAPPDAPPEGAGLGGLVFQPLELLPPDASGTRTMRGRVLFRGFTPGGDLPIDDVDGVAEISWLRLGDDAGGHGVFRIRRATIFDLRVQDVTAHVAWEHGILKLDPLEGLLAEGRLEGRLMVHTRKPIAYEGAMRLEGFRLALLRDDLAPTGPPLSGTGRAEIEFQNRSGDARDLTARGSVSITHGNLGDLPILANIFAFLGSLLDVPDPPRFERANAVFKFRDEVLQLSRFDLAGPLFEMPGRGTVDLGGYVDLVFTPDFIKSFAVPGIMQLPVVGNVLDAVLREDLLYAIRLRGDISTAEPEVVLFPPLGLEEERPFEGTGIPKPPPRRVPRWFR